MVIYMNGVILINKPKDFTSRDVVNIISRELNTKKIGHTGTLDPIATGVLALCVGNCTKLVDLITAYNKEYIAEIILGIETDTLDITGNIVNSCEINVTNKQIEEVLNTFIGKQRQEVPKYSAIKINGKKLYEYARNNIDIELPLRDIEIFNIELINYTDNKITIKCNVSKGTYIRSLVRDIGTKLNTYATMSNLIRTKQGDFNIEDCNTIDDIKNNNYKLLSIEEVLKNFSSVVVNRELELKIRNGALIDKFFRGDKVLILNEDMEVLAIYQTYDKDNMMAKPYKMLCNKVVDNM